MVKANISGEKKIEKILDELQIKYDRRKKIVLKKDAKKFRIPDFFLPKYNLTIEYFGSWNNIKNKAMEKRERQRFMEKVGAYESSGIDCIYLYPDELIHAKKIIEKKINEIDNPISEDILKQTTVNEKKEVIKKEENKIIFPQKPKIKSEDSGIKKFILFTIGTIIILFLILLIMGIINFLEGNPLVNPLEEIYNTVFSLFIFVSIISISASILFALQKELSRGIVFVGLILIAFFTITLFFFGDPISHILTILVITLAVVPSEYYMVTSN